MLKFLFLVVAICLCWHVSGFAQPGISEMNQATGDLKRSFFSARDATMVLAAIFGITGAGKIYHNWQMGKDRHITAEVAAWFFAAFFMILLGPFLQVLFGI